MDYTLAILSSSTAPSSSASDSAQQLTISVSPSSASSSSSGSSSSVVSSSSSSSCPSASDSKEAKTVSLSSSSSSSSPSLSSAFASSSLLSSAPSDTIDPSVLQSLSPEDQAAVQAVLQDDRQRQAEQLASVFSNLLGSDDNVSSLLSTSRRSGSSSASSSISSAMSALTVQDKSRTSSTSSSLSSRSSLSSSQSSPSSARTATYALMQLFAGLAKRDAKSKPQSKLQQRVAAFWYDLLNESTEKEPCYALLRQICSKIIQFPKDPKYRCLNISKIKAKMKLQTAWELIPLLGFTVTKDEQCWILADTASLDPLTECLSQLNYCLTAEQKMKESWTCPSCRSSNIPCLSTCQKCRKQNSERFTMFEQAYQLPPDGLPTALDFVISAEQAVNSGMAGAANLVKLATQFKFNLPLYLSAELFCRYSLSSNMIVAIFVFCAYIWKAGCDTVSKPLLCEICIRCARFVMDVSFHEKDASHASYLSAAAQLAQWLSVRTQGDKLANLKEAISICRTHLKMIKTFTWIHKPARLSHRARRCFTACWFRLRMRLRC
eukprot:TRINITY_DN1658_c0_g1_i5.p1 TRINITY_DN1658_c0_g1~~TRINITY_DN1658_c0_g1_i5.p1  ORF type:complete len:549 (+),score=137.83 TRINITY_DN1658_c0_g1_i5:114-1760(+)